MEISDILIAWYQKHKRDLPWRSLNDPYLIWISEIILQQTRVAQGLDYFLRFTERFPNVRSLAEAEEDEVLKYWQGLGYYSRARNLHAAAHQVMERFGGEFPTEYKDVLSLKGIGEYTAAAIVSFVWNKPYPVVDGNVFRVLARLFALDTPIDTGKGKKAFTDLASSVMNPEKAGLHNQAIMEFGALQCVPQSPDCAVCPLQSKCLGYANGSPQAYPVKQNKTKTRNRYFHYLHIIHEGKIWLNRRSGKDIWKGLYEFPMIETEQPLDFAQLQETDAFKQLLKDAGNLSVSVELSGIKHVLSHQILYASFYKIETEKQPEGLQPYLEIPADTISDYAVPRLLQLYLERDTNSLYFT
ncbi:A/G-specific adenine glycosylase [Parabacteroides sp. PF5-5]|uniref:A/G-specific adenine glycosylase n=1 Tax=unclassified Parabacteroides TaxID=2649774 RepID=UPI002475EE3A|nr:MULTISPECIES: A/G-specific adenine glycosylase [unclassified Parabacteroides]MDH6306663.1 A/G-specific adenine glycosylase [Parabacteroides sp. PH5-39]MDH6317630.1 A/G-specific adenine glycosylase [Parabacteroides sp. PF5-13]MDH6321374.1 A/G-specific adenine glycosylase [Parabacteroides sp. PH5-13]MDH6325061.1 A/G-specific adenine glycosylase [Parabacteroides sp. PH5-8]MDH6328770.1 A/G-specific adenine glycosylase [Parabacteroides sp. PH5-41]